MSNFMKNTAQASIIKECEMEELSMAAAGRQLNPVVGGGHKGSGNCYLDIVALSGGGDEIINHQNSSNISKLPLSRCSSKVAKRGHLWGGRKPHRLDLINSYNGGVTTRTEENTISYVSLLNHLLVQNAAFQLVAPLIRCRL